MLLHPKVVLKKKRFCCCKKRGSSFWNSNLGAGRSALQFEGCCFQASPRRYAGIDGSRGECVHGDDASAAPVSHLQRLQGTEQKQAEDISR